MLALIFLVAALVLFVLAAIPVATRISLGWLGAACVVAAFLCDRLGAA
jgi:hypothetical protein